jgi:hypothetical protein
VGVRATPWLRLRLVRDKPPTSSARVSEGLRRIAFHGQNSPNTSAAREDRNCSFDVHPRCKRKSMHKHFSPVVVLWFALAAGLASGDETKVQTLRLPLNSLHGFDVVNGKAEITTYRGRRAVHLVPLPDHRTATDAVLAILTGRDFKDGTIEVEVAGSRRADSRPDDRGFIGIAFRVQSQGSRFENIYLRPANGRADDQFRRNHSVQYCSEPDFPWQRLREENPGQYESYVDLEPGVWTRMKIVVSGIKASLHINGTPQPCLIVNDLKLGEMHGQIALWAHWSTDGYFSNLTVREAVN